MKLFKYLSVTLLLVGTLVSAGHALLTPDYCDCTLGVKLDQQGQVQLTCSGECAAGDSCREELYDLNWYSCDCDTSENSCICFGRRSTNPATPKVWTCQTFETCSNNRDCDERTPAEFWQDACECVP